MRVSYLSEAKVKAQEIEVLGALASVAEDYLRDVVKTISIPRHFRSEPGNNRFVAEWIRRAARLLRVSDLATRQLCERSRHARRECTRPNKRGSRLKAGVHPLNDKR